MRIISDVIEPGVFDNVFSRTMLKVKALSLCKGIPSSRELQYNLK